MLLLLLLCLSSCCVLYVQRCFVSLDCPFSTFSQRNGLLVVGFISYLRYLCLFAHIVLCFSSYCGIPHILCCVFLRIVVSHTYCVVFFFVLWYPTHIVLCFSSYFGIPHILCCVFIRLVYPMWPVSLVCPLLIAPSVFPNVHFNCRIDDGCIKFPYAVI
jgi:hypothetical protein